MSTNLNSKTLIANWVEEVRVLCAWQSHGKTVHVEKLWKLPPSFLSLLPLPSPSSFLPLPPPSSLSLLPPPSPSFLLLQRQCAHLEEGNRNQDGTLMTKLHREGHKVLEGMGLGLAPMFVLQSASLPSLHREFSAQSWKLLQRSAQQ